MANKKQPLELISEYITHITTALNECVRNFRDSEDDFLDAYAQFRSTYQTLMQATQIIKPLTEVHEVINAHTKHFTTNYSKLPDSMNSYADTYIINEEMFDDDEEQVVDNLDCDDDTALVGEEEKGE